MPKVNHSLTKAEKRRLRVRAKLFGTAERPRLTVLRSNQHTYLQVVNDVTGMTLVAASDFGKNNQSIGTKTERAAHAAQKVADQLKKKKVTALVFDRGSYKYHGRVKAVAETLREAGIQV